MKRPQPDETPAGIKLKTLAESRRMTHLTAAAGADLQRLEILTLVELEWFSKLI